MKKIQSIFKKSHKFILSAIAILLAVTMLPVYAFAEGFTLNYGDKGNIQWNRSSRSDL